MVLKRDNETITLAWNKAFPHMHGPPNFPYCWIALRYVPLSLLTPSILQKKSPYFFSFSPLPPSPSLQQQGARFQRPPAWLGTTCSDSGVTRDDQIRLWRDLRRSDLASVWHSGSARFSAGFEGFWQWRQGVSIDGGNNPNFRLGLATLLARSH